MFGLIQRTKKGLEALSVAIKECRESYEEEKYVHVDLVSFYVFKLLSTLGTHQKQEKENKPEE